MITCSDETEDIILIYEEDNFITTNSKRKSEKSPKAVTCILGFICLFSELVCVVPRILKMCGKNPKMFSHILHCL